MQMLQTAFLARVPAHMIAAVRFRVTIVKILCLAPYIPTGNPKQGTSYENGPNYLLAKPCIIHTLLDDLAIVYAKLLPSGASV